MSRATPVPNPGTRYSPPFNHRDEGRTFLRAAGAAIPALRHRRVSCEQTRLAPFCRNLNSIEDGRLQRISLKQLIVIEIKLNIAKDAILPNVRYELRLADRALLDVVILSNRDIAKTLSRNSIDSRPKYAHRAPTKACNQRKLLAAVTSRRRRAALRTSDPMATDSGRQANLCPSSATADMSVFPIFPQKSWRHHIAPSILARLTDGRGKPQHR